MKRPRISAILRATVGLVFVSAGVLKLLDIQQFAIDVHNFRLTPWSVSLAVALYLPWLEILAGGVFASGWSRFRDGAHWTLLVLVAGFLVALGSAWTRNLDIECGCFGEAAGTTVPWAFMRAMVLGGILGVLRMQRCKG